MNFCSSENTQPQVLQTYQEVDLSAGTEESLISTATDDEIGLYDCEWGTCGIVYTNKTVFIKHVAEIHTKVIQGFFWWLSFASSESVCLTVCHSFYSSSPTIFAVNGGAAVELIRFCPSMICCFTSECTPESGLTYVM